MVQANVEVRSDEYQPTEKEQSLIAKHLGGSAIIDKNYQASVFLTKQQAVKRRELIREVQYDFCLALQKGDTFMGQATINFYLNKMPGNDEELFLNSQALAIADLVVNDKPSPAGPESFRNQVIPLKVADVNKGWNTVTLRYLKPYNTNSVGLHTFTDSTDQNQYLYTQFEAFHCFRVFPCFDQPDLKAKMTLITTCPSDWHAVSNAPEHRYGLTEGAENGRHILEHQNIEWFLEFYESESDVVITRFETTPTISTYLYAICAGPYKIFSDTDPMYVPQRILVRQSLVENLKPELMFGITKTTIDFYQKNFGARYPFAKVDHVMCPDYKYGAMENVGCITYADSWFCAEKDPSQTQMTFFCVVIQHELSHQWFGNLVTMKWWNDLWLNEAFATSLSYRACSEGGPFVEQFQEDSWLHMASYKRWGLGDDLTPSNHKIQAECANTDGFESLIDGITYGKGSSMIKQLIFLIGWETFCKGLQIYFNKYAWTNTELPQFIGAMQQSFDENRPGEVLDLNKWSADWLQTKGVNQISHEFEQADGKYTSFKIRQTPCKNADAVYREQRFNIGLYDCEGNLTDKIADVKIQSHEVTQIEAMIGKNVPAAVLLNSDDWGFGHFIMDEATIKIFENKLCKVQSKIDRAVIIGQLITMMRQIQYPATRLLQVLNQLLDEENQLLIDALYGALVMAQDTYLPSEMVPRFNQEATEFFLKKAKQEKGKDSLVQLCISKALTFVTSEEHLRKCAEWIYCDGKIQIEGEDTNVQLTPPQKYDILKRYWAHPAFSMQDKNALREKTLADDQSDAATQTKKVLEYILPDPALKERLWAELLDEKSNVSLMENKLKIEGFWQRQIQSDLIAPYYEKYFANIKRVVNTRDRQFAEYFMNTKEVQLDEIQSGFVARESDEATVNQLLSEQNDETNFLTLFLKKQVDVIDRVKRSRELCERFKIE